MKKNLLSVFLLIFAFTLTGCSTYSDEEIIGYVQNNTLEGYGDKKIGMAIKDCFNDQDIEWTVIHNDRKGKNIYSVEVSIRKKNDNYIEFTPNYYGADTMLLDSIYIVFDYDSENKSTTVDYIYGIINSGKLQSFQTESQDENSIFLNRIFDHVE